MREPNYLRRKKSLYLLGRKLPPPSLSLLNPRAKDKIAEFDESSSSFSLFLNPNYVIPLTVDPYFTEVTPFIKYAGSFSAPFPESRDSLFGIDPQTSPFSIYNSHFRASFHSESFDSSEHPLDDAGSLSFKTLFHIDKIFLPTLYTYYVSEDITDDLNLTEEELRAREATKAREIEGLRSGRDVKSNELPWFQVKSMLSQVARDTFYQLDLLFEQKFDNLETNEKNIGVTLPSRQLLECGLLYPKTIVTPNLNIRGHKSEDYYRELELREGHRNGVRYTFPKEKNGEEDSDGTSTSAKENGKEERYMNREEVKEYIRQRESVLDTVPPPYLYDDIIDLILSVPDITLSELSGVFKYSEKWIMSLTNSDSFRNRLAYRRDLLLGERGDRIKESLSEKLETTTLLAIDKVNELLAKEEEGGEGGESKEAQKLDLFNVLKLVSDVHKAKLTIEAENKDVRDGNLTEKRRVSLDLTDIIEPVFSLKGK